MTGWEKALPLDREALVRLVRREEWNQLHFSSVLREKKGFRLVHDGMVYLLRDRGRKPLRGGIYISRGGAFHCCFEPSDLRQEDLDRLERIMIERSLFSLIGRKDRIELAEKLYGARDSYVIDYDMMIRDELSDWEPLPTGMTIRRAGRDDLEALYPLEEAYQIEEVIRDPDSLNRRYLKKRFHRQLGELHIWAVYRGDTPIAKGGTNAEGFAYCQIGGIYTIPRERGQGVGRHLMNHIGRELKKENRGTSLFVRKDNFAARKLYENCGYQNKGDFRIVYPD